MAAAGREPERRSVRTIARLAAPLAAAVGIFGVSFGILARSTGFSWVAAIVMSALTFAGSAQFAAVSVLSGGGAATAAIVAAVMLNSRYLPIGISAASALTGRWPRRALEGQLVVDESWAVASLGGGRFDRRTMIGTGLALYVAWIVGTAVGAIGGSALGDPVKLGLDAAFPALFLALLVPQVRAPRRRSGPSAPDARRSRRPLAAAILGAAIAFVLIPFAPAGVPIIAGSAACLVGLRGRPEPIEPMVEGLP